MVEGISKKFRLVRSKIELGKILDLNVNGQLKQWIIPVGMVILQYYYNGGRNFEEIPTRSIEDRTRKDSGFECKWTIHAMDYTSRNGHIAVGTNFEEIPTRSIKFVS
jgi:hypothetical protein